jgi:hypothetical protein
MRAVPVHGAPLIDQYIAQLNVTNTGKVAGAEVAQLVSDPRMRVSLS